MKFGIGNSACGGAFLLVVLFFGVPWCLAVWATGVFAENWPTWKSALLWGAVFLLGCGVWWPFVAWADNRAEQKNEADEEAPRDEQEEVDL